MALLLMMSSQMPPAAGVAPKQGYMNKKRKPQPQEKQPHMEKQNMTEPMEEFVADQSVPSRSMKSERSKSSSSPQRAHDIKPAGHQNDRVECFEPGVEG